MTDTTDATPAAPKPHYFSMSANWTEYEEGITPEKMKRVSRRAYLLLRPFWPEIFHLDSPRPLAVGVTGQLLADARARELQTEAPGKPKKPVSRKLVARAIHYLTSHIYYMDAVAAGEFRYDIHGNTTPLKEIHKDYARECIVRLRQAGISSMMDLTGEIENKNDA